MFQKLARIEREYWERKHRRKCGKKGHCIGCKRDRLHYCCNCMSVISKDCPGYISHLEEGKKVQE